MTINSAQLNEQVEPRWFCLKTQPKRENIAASTLRQVLGVEVLAPRIRFRKATRRGPVWFVEALFPGYVFAHFNYVSQNRQVQSLPGVASVVKFGDLVGVLEDAVIAQIRVAAGDEETIVYAPTFQVGDVVKIAEGSFSGLNAIITHLLPARERVKVLLEFLGRSVEAEIALPSVLSTAPARSAHAN